MIHGAYVVVILGFVFQGGFGEEATTMLEQPQPALVSSSEISPSLSHRDQAYKNEKNDMKTIDKPRTLTIMLQQRKRPAAPGAPHVPREVVRQQKRTKHRQTKLDLLNKRSRRGQPEGSGDRERDLSSDAAAIVQLTGHPVITYHALLHMGSDMQDLWVVRSTFCIYTFILSFFLFWYIKKRNGNTSSYSPASTVLSSPLPLPPSLFLPPPPSFCLSSLSLDPAFLIFIYTYCVCVCCTFHLKLLLLNPFLLFS